MLVKANQKIKMAGLQLRTKWLVEHVTDHGMYGGTPHKKVKLNTVYSHDKNTEDNQFSNATPSGDCQQVITNPNDGVQAFFKPGVKYYATWEECEDQS